MGGFRKILLSGSNAHVRKLLVSDLELDNDVNNKVVMYDTTTGQFFFTGSYTDGGRPPAFNGSFDGDMDLTVPDGSDATRTINIGTNRTTAGKSQINFFNSPNSIPGFSIDSSVNGTNFIYSASSGEAGALNFILNGPIADRKFVVGIDAANAISTQNFTINGQGQITAPHLASTTSAAVNLVYNTTSKQIRYSASSKKLKTNIKSLDNSILKAFNELRPVTFNSLEDTLQTSTPPTIVGFIAEECADAHPTLAAWGPNYRVNDKGVLATFEGPVNDELVPTDIQSRAILALVVAKIQELDNKIKELKKLKSNGTI
jgi:hypothetical protein